MEKWERFFKGLLGKIQWKVRKKRGRTKGDKNEEEEISREEMDMAIKNLKNGKSAGEDNWK